MLDDASAESTVTRLWPDWLDNRERSKEWQDWALGRQPLPVVPDTSTAEYHELQNKAVTPWLGLVVQAFAQPLIVEGYRSSVDNDESVLWSVWQANRMDAKQSSLYEGACTTGTAYLAVLPVDAARPRSTPTIEGDVKVPEWRPYSSAEMTAFYESPHDDWPVYALAGEPGPVWKQRLEDGVVVYRATLLDETHLYTLDIRNGVASLAAEPQEHGSQVTPVVSYVPRRTITGRAIGEVEPHIAVASRIDQDVLDRLVVQRFASWRVRYATGLVTPATDEDQAAQELALKVSDILISDSTDTTFGSLPATEMDGHLRAPMEDVRMLSAVAQVPPTILTADLTNISAEALAAVDSSYNRKIEHMKEAFGESHEKSFDLSARLMGIEPDHAAQVRWRDMESRSLAQTADALGKIAQTLEVPVEVLWDKVGFLSDQDRKRAKEIRSEQDALGSLLAAVDRSITPTEPVEPAA